MRLAAECLLVGLHADFFGVADANRGRRSITNDAERVVTELLATEQLLPHQRLLYRDTLGRWEELVHDGRRFTGFRHIGSDSFGDAIRRARGLTRRSEP
ncbi:MAG: hypothetical protein EHM78_26760 [Myxococcaceae bacterium]|nr:MAG: hypothetical protein EHM78_26760 [Myxococcaceae bacterium]